MGEYEDDGDDDFGLPSLSHMKRRKRKTAAGQGAVAGEPSPGLDPPISSFHSRRYSDSADIAIERPTPSYPMPKKSEGKILRPQYKEILRGTSYPLSTALCFLCRTNNGDTS